MNNDLISRSALKKAIAEFHQEENERLHTPLWGSIGLNALDRLINNAPKVEIEETDAYKKGYNKGWRAGRGEQKRLHNLADERPIGDSEWIYEDTTADGYRVFYCKQCGAEVYLTDAYDECTYKYCHDCGRRMKEGKVTKNDE